ncbi:ARM repeat-containing protein [Agrocybe pediades]|nr:ARM repeat-containing protein [Agrocybe pediades]
MEYDFYPQPIDAAKHAGHLERREALIDYVQKLPALEVPRSSKLLSEHLPRLMNIASREDAEMEDLPLEYQQEVLDSMASALTAEFLLSISGPGDEYPMLAVLEVLLGGIAMEPGRSREVAVSAFRDMLTKMNAEAVKQVMLSSLCCLADNRGSSKSRQSASELLGDVYLAVGDNSEAKETIRNVTIALSKDVMTAIVVSVSRSLTVCLDRGISADEIDSFILPLYEEFKKDEHPHVRSGACDILLSLVARGGRFRDIASSGLNACIQDRHWSVRLIVANHFPKFYDALGPDLATRKGLAHLLNRLLGDVNLLVRQKSLEILKETMESMEREIFIEFVAPTFMSLACDLFSQVRLALAQNIEAIWAYMNDVNSNMTIDPVLIDILSALLQDSESTQVLLCTLDNLLSETIVKDIPIDSTLHHKLEAYIARALGQIVDLKDKQWRFRQFALDMVPDLVSTYFTSGDEVPLIGVLRSMVSALHDPVWSVRMSATDNIPKFMSAISAKACYPALKTKAMEAIVVTVRNSSSHAARTAALIVLNSLMSIFEVKSCTPHKLCCPSSTVPCQRALCRIYALRLMY